MNIKSISASQCRVEYGIDGLLDEVVTDSGMHLENLGDNNWHLIAYKSDGSSIAIHMTGRVAMVEDRPAPDFVPGPEVTAFGRISVQVMPCGDMVLRREGQVGRGASRESRMWCLDQVEAALISARNRRGEDAVCEVRALEWAMQRLRKRGGS